MSDDRGLRVVKIDPDGTIVMSDPEYCDGDEYNCGETLAQFGLDNLTDEEKNDLGRQDNPVRLKAVVVVDIDVHSIVCLDSKLAEHLATWFDGVLRREDQETDDYYVKDLTVYTGLVGFDDDRREMIADFDLKEEDAWELGNQVSDIRARVSELEKCEE